MVAVPLKKLIKGKPSLPCFKSTETKAFQGIKGRLTTALVLEVYDMALPIGAKSDASKLAVGAVLE